MAETLYLLYVLKDALDWQKHDKVLRGKEALNKLTKYLFERDKLDIPCNLSELYSFLLTEPCCNYLDSISSGESFVNTEGVINNEIKEKLDEENPDEKIQAEIMRSILMICRNESSKILEDESEEEKQSRKVYWEKVYCDARSYISETCIRGKKQLDIDIINRFPVQISTIIKKGYISDRQINGEQQVCPVCGKVAIKENSDLCENEVCNYYIKKNRLEPKSLNSSERYVVLAPGLYTFILSPGLAERLIYHKIKKKFNNYEVTLYPNIDEYDINVSYGEKVIHLDIKDAKTPEVMVRKLMEDSNIDKLKMGNHKVVWIVIPEHRISIYKKSNDSDYVQKAKQLLKNENLNIEVVRECNLFNKIELEMEENEEWELN